MNNQQTIEAQIFSLPQVAAYLGVNAQEMRNTLERYPFFFRFNNRGNWKARKATVEAWLQEQEKHNSIGGGL